MTATFTDAGFAKITFNGSNGAGSISVPGVKVGDLLIVVAVANNPPSPGLFNVIVVTDDEIVQQSTSDLSGDFFTGVTVRVP